MSVIQIFFLIKHKNNKFKIGLLNKPFNFIPFIYLLNNKKKLYKKFRKVALNMQLVASKLVLVANKSVLLASIDDLDLHFEQLER